MIDHASNVRWSFSLPRMRICPRCHDLYGECGKPTPQRCRCPDAPDDAAWPHHDFNRLVEPCKCCGLQLLRTGSRWAVWFCGECKERVGQLNAHHGRCVVPIGRHTFHAGYMLDGDDAQDPVEIHAFVQGMKGLFEAMDVVRDWAARAVTLNVRHIGFDPDGDTVGIIPYVEGLRCKRPSKEERFHQMVRFFQQESRKRAEKSGA